jgi:hypothetical protein
VGFPVWPITAAISRRRFVYRVIRVPANPYQICVICEICGYFSSPYTVKASLAAATA